MLLEDGGTLEKTQTTIAPFIGVGFLTMSKSDRAGCEVDTANETIVLGVVFIEEEELAALPHLDTLKFSHVVLLFDRVVQIYSRRREGCADFELAVHRVNR